MTKLEKLQRELNDTYAEVFDREFKKQFGTEVETKFCIIEMNLVSTRQDGEPLTDEQQKWSAAFSAGYNEAMNVVSARTMGK